jgi:hypothetical protein
MSQLFPPKIRSCSSRVPTEEKNHQIRTIGGCLSVLPSARTFGSSSSKYDGRTSSKSQSAGRPPALCFNYNLVMSQFIFYNECIQIATSAWKWHTTLKLPQVAVDSMTTFHAISICCEKIVLIMMGSPPPRQCRPTRTSHPTYNFPQHPSIFHCIQQWSRFQARMWPLSALRVTIQMKTIILEEISFARDVEFQAWM